MNFNLNIFNEKLYLTVKNVGKTNADNINIIVEKIFNNGNNNLEEDYIFTIPFDLSPNEKVIGMIAYAQEETYDVKPFPYIILNVRYYKPYRKKRVQYERKVYYTSVIDKNISVDTNIDLS